jgi:hypothetical protein
MRGLVTAAQLALSVRLKDSDLSENTKNAQAIAKAWRGAVHNLNPDRFQIEAMVARELDQKIDIVGTSTVRRNCPAWSPSPKRNTGDPSLTLRCHVRTSSIWEKSQSERRRCPAPLMSLLQPPGHLPFGAVSLRTPNSSGWRRLCQALNAQSRCQLKAVIAVPTAPVL